MRGPHIYCEVRLDRYPSSRDFKFVIPINEGAARESFCVLDEPSRDADLLTAVIFCTPADTVRRIKENRSSLAREIAAKILDYIESHDLTMGYERPKPGG